MEYALKFLDLSSLLEIGENQYVVYNYRIICNIIIIMFWRSSGEH